MIRYVEREDRAYSVRELAGALFTREDGTDVHPNHVLNATYFCWNDQCPCEELDVHATWPDGDRPESPQFKCPSCGGPLELTRFLAHRTLVPETSLREHVPPIKRPRQRTDPATELSELQEIMAIHAEFSPGDQS